MSTINTAQNLTSASSQKNLPQPLTRVSKTDDAHRGKEVLILFGNPKDPEVAERINKAYITGKKVEVKLRPDFDTGVGMCGNHLCHCKGVCKEQYLK